MSFKVEVHLINGQYDKSFEQLHIAKSYAQETIEQGFINVNGEKGIEYYPTTQILKVIVVKPEFPGGDK